MSSRLTKRLFVCATISIVASLITYRPAVAQSAFSVSNFTRASEVLDRALEALGAANVSKFENLSASFSGQTFARGQSWHPGPPFDSLAISGVLAYDTTGRVFREDHFVNGGGTDRSYRRAILPDGGWNLWVARDLMFELRPSDVSFLTQFPSQSLAAAFPHSVLERARRARATLRWLGQDRSGELALSWVSFSESDGSSMSIGFDDATGVPTRFEKVGADPIEGDVANVVRFEDYRSVEGLKIPYGITFSINEIPLLSWSLADVRVNQGIASLLDAPAGIAVSEHPAAFSPSLVAPGVFSVRVYSGPGNGYNIGIVVFDEYVVVLEAPLVDFLYGPITRLVNSVAPGKPIKYVVTTHAHSDHLGGVRGFLAGGVDVITTADAATVISRMSETRSILGFNPLATSSEPGRVITVADSMVITDGSRELHILQVGPTPHVAEMLLPYLPAEGVVYVADLFAIPENRMFPPPSDTFRCFGEIVESRGLNVRHIIPTHGLVGTAADLAEGTR